MRFSKCEFLAKLRIFAPLGLRMSKLIQTNLQVQEKQWLNARVGRGHIIALMHNHTQYSGAVQQALLCWLSLFFPDHIEAHSEGRLHSSSYSPPFYSPLYGGGRFHSRKNTRLCKRKHPFYRLMIAFSTTRALQTLTPIDPGWPLELPNRKKEGRGGL